MEDSLLVCVVHTNANYLVGLRLPLMKNLRARGKRVVALAPNMSREHAEVLARHGIDAHPCRLDPTGMNPLRDIANAVSLSRQLKQLAPDMLLTNTAKAVVFGTLAGFIARVPQRFALLSGLGFAFTPDGKPPTLRKTVARALMWCFYAITLRMNRAVIFHNSDDLAELVSLKACPPGRCVVVSGSGIDIQEFAFRERDWDSPVFVMVGRLLVEKGTRVFLEAARMTKAVLPGARFIVVGARDGNPSALPAGEIEQYVADGIVEWAGGVDDVRPWLYQGTVFTLPSYREGVPRSTLEAMATGMAIITTDVPGCRESVAQGLNGILVPVRDSGALSKAMIQLAGDPRRVSAMARESRMLAENRFEVSVVNEQMCRAMGIQSKPSMTPSPVGADS
jgi:glycosyltransferase involved in cell wall biosynthesis